MPRPRIPRNHQPYEPPTDYRLIPTKRPHHLSASASTSEPLLFLANGQVLTQNPNLPSRRGQVGFQELPSREVRDLPLFPKVQPATDNARDVEHTSVPEGPYDDTARAPKPRAQKRHNQSLRWRTEVIPQLVYPYMNMLRLTENLHNDPEPREWSCSCGSRGLRTLKVTIVRFSRLSELELDVCDCTPAAVMLVQRGLFPCAPCFPTLAVDIRVLDFVKALFLRVAPNHTAWCDTVTEFLAQQGFRMRGKDPLRRRFSNALQWYGSLKHATKGFVDQVLQQCRSDQQSPSDTEAESDSLDGDCRPSRSSSRMSYHENPPDSSPPSSRPTSPAYGLYEADEGDTSSRSSTPQDEDGHDDDVKRARPNDMPHEPLDRPSDYLRSRCPLCFGGRFPDSNYDFEFDAIVCIDACFTQKHNKGGGRDPHKQHPDTVFMDEEEVRSMEDYVDSIRPTTSRPRNSEERGEGEEEDDGYEGAMKVPRSALDGCEASFTAADERREKASTQFFDCTALMALLCRHDRVLWIANMTSAGEKQHYVLALVEKLFEHLPPGFKVGLLYDIACQLERSCIKWEFLREYWERLGFAISVFHAFGHHWPCQVIYHPRKRTGFGLSDGEGCERFWHSISRLIPYLRICGYYQRLYTLDCQVEHADNQSLQGLGVWILRKRSDAHGAEWAGNKEIEESGYSAEYLREQWELQKVAQTKPLPRKSNQQGKKAVEEVMRLRSSLEMLRKKQEELESVVMDLDADPYDYAEATESLPGVKQRVAETQRKLRVKEQLLGVEEQQEVRHLTRSPFLRDQMNAVALKTRLMSHLRARKFQRDRLERSFRKQINEQKIHAQITQSVKRKDPSIQKLARDYNKLVSKMQKTINDHRAPRNAVAPRPIPLDKLFTLDVDDDIWQDVGLTDEWDSGAPPPWLGNEGVRAGIRAVLQLDRGQEEILRLAHERDSMQRWFSEEWAVLMDAIERTVHPDVQYQLLQRKQDLLRLCCRWQHSIGNTAPSPGVPEWGPSAEELAQMRWDMEVELVEKEDWEQGEDSGGGGPSGGEALDSDDEAEGVEYDEMDFNTLQAFDTAEPHSEDLDVDGQ
ncbi:hypothetical protein V5O48_007108 [Marasmius crinis-equi]|uniref:CxC1-like cysteine cluster associated with KDZ transposases domain-containing protein n=1 Tax=Marasmius crinis-equi TaxID=585013 RepID=A0ABR3FHL8_9AGAR